MHLRSPRRLAWPALAREWRMRRLIARIALALFVSFSVFEACDLGMFVYIGSETTFSECSAKLYPCRVPTGGPGGVFLQVSGVKVGS